ncbi:carbohydrate kinase family protein [Nitrospirillum sp. BR 11163]|uniref:carbohydrate kinase family protein n=1 Tax=Nitrospirillum sp. BR 11163 TaxID=3104323 RepID=UPI002AFED0A8|nr:carbohydrate kinase family protein [Nitrospirillum sp. BR 11163]MEA1673168.1 carbohydrate kinase family protein [Nitrospirillum sp. BR 11163]
MSVTKTHDVAVVGELYIDHVLSGFTTWPQPGEEVVTDAYTREVGGGAANTACGLARLGRAVQLVGIVGEADAAWFRQRLAPYALDTGGLRIGDGATGISISVSTREDRSFFTHIGVNRALPALLSDPATVAGLARARHVHFALPLDRAVADALLPALRDAGCTTSLDVGFQPGWLPDPENHATCRAVDHLLPNEKEAALFCGSDGTEDYLSLARRLALPNPVLKLGRRGALGLDGDATLGAAPPPVDAVDTTGAGDAFDAGYIDALLDGAPVLERLRRACICGALSTRVAGALGGIPDRTELWSTYEQSYQP